MPQLPAKHRGRQVPLCSLSIMGSLLKLSRCDIHKYWPGHAYGRPYHAQDPVAPRHTASTTDLPSCEGTVDASRLESCGFSAAHRTRRRNVSGTTAHRDSPPPAESFANQRDCVRRTRTESRSVQRGQTVHGETEFFGPRRSL